MCTYTHTHTHALAYTRTHTHALAYTYTHALHAHSHTLNTPINWNYPEALSADAVPSIAEPRA